ncbi:putative secretion ATPase (PEP-CTERM system associated) [Methylohalomonas lacus]|uniref:Secretion ATPase (PEP-CTERM system associated) n=1 Tax=Methylohalomonas lacus TaxID=398773 RepID=A0AAE3HNE6_9GAMM|nr:XrtA/PEP-CTERM system-associated ATPase [Methylohalomonas lacus]MCS3904334.1 putative secretion ATPase (PEP-CTERM system associated) [Methylohalomonas lacus]
MYESFYKLKRNPFLLTADPGFFFNSRTHKRALSYLLYGLQQEEGFIVITGDVGAGKTTLVSYLLKKIENQNYTIANIVNSKLQAEDLLRLTSAEFGLRYKDINKAYLLKNMYQYFKSCAHAGKRILLIVDEAQNLPWDSLEELRMLSNLQWQGKPLVQCFLLGQKQFKRILQAADLEQLRQRIIATHHLEPLDLQETKEYIIHRLKLSGWQNDPIIDNDVIEGIHQFTGGIPRKINLLCGRVLLYGHVEELHRIDNQSFEAILDDVKNEFWNENSDGSSENQITAEFSYDAE